MLIMKRTMCDLKIVVKVILRLDCHWLEQPSNSGQINAY